MRRKLSPEETALWARVARTVEPLEGRKHPPRQGEGDQPKADGAASRPGTAPKAKALRAAPSRRPPSRPVEDTKQRPLDRHGLDAGWDKKLGRGLVYPDFTLDLHGCSLDAAHSRLLHGLSQAKAMGARLVLVITGKPRPADSADRGSSRGAIRAKVVDWLAASDLAFDIAAIRSAHRRHGGPGALYVVLKRRREPRP